EIGALCSALVGFSKFSFIGGQHNKGHGLVDLNYSVDDKLFFKVVDMKVTMSDEFKDYLDKYNNHLIENKALVLELLLS
ncbi:hypothetical protein KAU11_03490, partial [Candidatus Babeliales bacterium]|nr:hypothetical protein [Candidatus Babeliales bacterium]